MVPVSIIVAVHLWSMSNRKSWSIMARFWGCHYYNRKRCWANIPGLSLVKRLSLLRMSILGVTISD